ncbi:hypothetical protein D6V10_21020, partial [Vibrio cholerae]|nr:hypothetical protein [Vibrio cholerae]
AIDQLAREIGAAREKDLLGSGNGPDAAIDPARHLAECGSQPLRLWRIVGGQSEFRRGSAPQPPHIDRRKGRNFQD